MILTSNYEIIIISSAQRRSMWFTTCKSPGALFLFEAKKMFADKNLGQSARQLIVECLRYHIIYPMERESLVGALKRTGEFTRTQKIWLESNLTEGVYGNDMEVVRTLGI